MTLKRFRSLNNAHQFSALNHDHRALASVFSSKIYVVQMSIYCTVVQTILNIILQAIYICQVGEQVGAHRQTTVGTLTDCPSSSQTIISNGANVGG
jgi:hypothetical protein